MAAAAAAAADEVGEVAPGESRKLFVGGIPSSAQDVELRGHFARFGAVRSMVLMRDKETGHSRGFGFVEFDDEEAADKALGDGENPKHFICGRLVSSPPFALTSD
jgi:RNA-binding protein Musashi